MKPISRAMELLLHALLYFSIFISFDPIFNFTAWCKAVVQPVN